MRILLAFMIQLQSIAGTAGRRRHTALNKIKGTAPDMTGTDSMTAGSIGGLGKPELCILRNERYPVWKQVLSGIADMILWPTTSLMSDVHPLRGGDRGRCGQTQGISACTQAHTSSHRRKQWPGLPHPRNDPAVVW